jgi:hypothetical protein
VIAESHPTEIQLRVIDHGAGVPADQQDRIFQPFQRLHDRSTTAGPGLGLAIARGFMEAMEWHLLEILVRGADRLITQQQLLQQVWGPAYQTETNYLRVHLANLRRKLEPDPAHPRYLITEPGIGYRFQLDANTRASSPPSLSLGPSQEYQ